MKLLPYENYIINTVLSRIEVINRLKLKIDPPTRFILWFSDKKSEKDYQGRFSANGFEIVRIIKYRNSFLPIITGTFMNGSPGTQIHVKMQLALFVKVFLCFCLGAISLFLIFLIVSQISNREFDRVILVPFGMFTFGYLLALFGFKYESAKSRQFLEELFK